ncbi:MAG TPA: DinB family protein [Candidatus Hydrogenedentes bacterium]|nr:DinB family protein [Candidatus Hydrogenedentota bacterium]
MDIEKVITSQYHASLDMLKGAIVGCPDDVWNDEEHKNRFWHIAYHALFYTHLYLQDREEDFVPWTKHRDEYQFMGSLPWPPHKEPRIEEAYSKEDVLSYLAECRNQVEERVPSLDLEAESGFSWLPFGKLELQFYNIRHIQHHAGQLIDRVRHKAGAGVGWVGTKSE